MAGIYEYDDMTAVPWLVAIWELVFTYIHGFIGANYLPAMSGLITAGNLVFTLIAGFVALATYSMFMGGEQELKGKKSLYFLVPYAGITVGLTLLPTWSTFADAVGSLIPVGGFILEMSVLSAVAGFTISAVVLFGLSQTSA